MKFIVLIFVKNKDEDKRPNALNNIKKEFTNLKVYKDTFFYGI